MLAVDARRIESERLLQAAAVDRVLFELKRLLGMAPDDPLSLTDSIEQLAPTEPFAPRPLSQVVADRGDVREADANLRLADARIDLARREGRVDMSVFGSYMRMDSGFPQLGIAANGSLAPIRSVFHYAAAGTTITLPLVNRRQGEIAAAQAQRSSADALLAAAQLRARTDVAAAMADDEGARAALAVYSSGVRALGRQNLDVVRQTYELGRATVNDVILEERRYVDLERAYTDLLTRAFEARTALQRAVGDRP
jgi:cobalt-zinc-cadmium efflux system outer membrane protein